MHPPRLRLGAAVTDDDGAGDEVDGADEDGAGAEEGDAVVLELITSPRAAMFTRFSSNFASASLSGIPYDKISISSVLTQY